jgi:hypothetical protein
MQETVVRKPRIFIASSSESLDVADAINVNLEHQAEVTVWKNGFKLSTSNIDSLVEKSKVMDFAILYLRQMTFLQSGIKANILFETTYYLNWVCLPAHLERKDVLLSSRET